MNIGSKSKVIYDNLYDNDERKGFFSYRKVEPIQKKMNDTEFHEKMMQQKNVLISTKIKSKYADKKYEYLHLKPLVIILLSEFNEGINKLSSILTLLKKIEKYNKNMEVIIIMDRQDSKISQFNEVLGDKATVYSFVQFAIVYPRCTQADKHRIMNPEEIENLINRLRLTSINMINVISRNDIMAIWCGAKLGDVLEINQYSETTIDTYVYRLVKK